MQDVSKESRHRSIFCLKLSSHISTYFFYFDTSGGRRRKWLQGDFQENINKMFIKQWQGRSYVMCVGGMLCELLPAEVGRYSLGLL